MPTAKFSGGSFLVEEQNANTVCTADDFGQRHHAIRERVQEFVRNEIVPNIERIEHKDLLVMRQLIRNACQAGIANSDVPIEYGGSNMDQICGAIIAQHIFCCASAGVSLLAHSCFGTLPISCFGTPEQKAKYLPKLSQGEWIAAYALSERASGTDAMNAHTHAVLSADGREWILNGEKAWVTNGGLADLFVVFARAEDSGISAFIVRRDAPGFRTGEEVRTMGLHGVSTCSLVLSDCRIPKENLLGSISNGHKVAFNTLNIGRVRLGLAAIGSARNSLQAAIEFARKRRAFGKTLSELGLIQQKIAKMAALTYVGEAMAYRTAGMIDEALSEINLHSGQDDMAIAVAIEEFAAECSIVKVWGSELLDYVADEALHIAGGIGFSEDCPMERSYRDSRVCRILGGTNEINRMIITGWTMKRSFEGKVGILRALKRLIIDRGADASASELPKGTLAAERMAVRIARQALGLVVDLASKRHGTEIANQQEVMVSLADVMIEIYAMDSTVLRTQKLINHEGEAGAASAIAMTQVGVALSLDKIVVAIRRIAAAVCDTEKLPGQLMNIYRLFMLVSSVNTIGLCQQIASGLIEKVG